MTVRRKALVIIGVVLIILTIIMYAITNTILLRSYTKLENDSMYTNIERLLSVLNSKLSTMNTYNHDWAAWDDTYNFIEDTNTEYIDTNLVDETFIGGQLNLMVFFNSSDQIVFSKAFDLANEEEVPVPQSFLEQISSNKLLLLHSNTESSTTGIIMLPEKPMLITSQPIMTSQNEGPIRGSLIMGRYLDAAQIEELANVIHLPVTLHLFESKAMPVDFQTARSSLSSESPIFVQPLNKDSIAGYALIYDIYGQPGFILKSDMPREIYIKGQETTSFFLLSVLVIGVLLSILTALFLDKFILSPLSKLGHDISHIGKSNDLSTRIPVTGADELAQLTNSVNLMLAELEQAHRGIERSNTETKFINGVMTTINQMNDVDEICRYVGEKVQSVNEKSLVLVTLYDKSIRAIRIRSISGISGFADRMNKLVGIDPFELHFKQDKIISNTRLYTGGKLARIPGGIYEIADGKIPEEICDKLETIFDLHDVYTVGFSLGELPLGGIVLFLPENQEVNLAYAIEVVASDVSLLIHRLNAEEELKQKLLFDETISSSFTRFVGTSSVDEAINALLADSGTMCGADRAYLFLFNRDGDKLSNSHEWCAEGIRPQMDTLQDLPCAIFPWWIDKLRKGETIYIRDVTTMPEEAQAEKKILGAQDIKAVLVLPLYIRNTLSGFIGFDNVITTAGWTENNISVLQTCSYIIGNAIEGQLAAQEKKQLEQHFHQVQRLESVGRLAGGVAHDLNNMLTPILGYSELLLEEANNDDKTRESLEGISNAGKRARDMVRQLLAFSRKQPLLFTNIDLNTLLRDFQKLLRSTIRENIRLRLVTSSSLPIIKGDIGQLEQVIMNLVINAQDAMPEGGKLTIETSLAELDESYAAEHASVVPGRYVRLSISDSGHGIGAEIREHIFEPFFTTKSKEKGTGLGLSIVYGIVKQHGGNIWVYSEPGKGTTFKVYLPAPGELQAKQTTDKETLINSHGSETILLVEDEEFVRKLAQTILKQSGYTVMTAQNGTEALLVLKSHHGSVDMMLTDVIMPDMNGKELFTRASKEYPGLKILYMSGYTDDVITQHGVLEEGTAFIQKPFTVQVLIAKIREVLGQ